jgi:hypothetical protein
MCGIDSQANRWRSDLKGSIVVQRVYGGSRRASPNYYPAQSRPHSMREDLLLEPRTGWLSSAWKAAAGIGALAITILGIPTAYSAAADVWNHTMLTIEMSTEMDQQKPFTLPLYIKNPSSIFDAHYPTVACKFSAVYSDGGTGLVTTNGGTFGAHKGPVIVAGGDPAVFYCSFSDNLTLANNDTGNPTPLASGNISVTIGYETWLPWWVVKRSTVPADFTLRKTSQGWRWTKGTEIK